MNKNYSKNPAIVLTAVLFLAFPLLGNAHNRNLTYRSTVAGTGVEKFAGDYNRIVGEKNDFSPDENIHVMTRVFNIKNVNNFRIKHHVIKNGNFYKDFYSKNYAPSRRWWAETYAWNSLGKLPEGNYDVQTYISVDNEPYNYHKNLAFHIANSGHNYQPTNYNYTNYNIPDYKQSNYQNFNYITTHTGAGVRDLGVWKYEVTNPKTKFTSNESLHVIGQLDKISGIDRFKLRYELYRDNSLYKTLYSWEQQPNGQYWAYNYTWVNFGKLPVGNYNLRTYININGGNYKWLNSKDLEVVKNYNYSDWNNDYNYSDWNNCSDCYDCLSCYNCYNNYYINTDNVYINTDIAKKCPYFKKSYDKYYWDYNDKGTYKYKKMLTGTGLKKIGSNNCGANYSVQTAKDTFYPNEDVNVITTVELDNVYHAEIRHDLYIKNNNSVSKSKTIELNCNFQDDSISVYSLFGKLVKGSHTIKSYIRINNENWKYLDTEYIWVVNYAGAYKYEWTKTGTSNSSVGWYSYAPSFQQKSNFKNHERLAIVTRLDNTAGLENYRVKHELLRGNNVEKVIESPKIYNSSYNDENEYYLSDFGYLYPGDYTIKVYVSINNGSYKKVDSEYVYVEHNNYYYNYY